jgi:hypothetical protein
MIIPVWSYRINSKVNPLTSIVNSLKIKRLPHIQKSIISACMGFSILSSAIVPPVYADGLESLKSISRGSEALDYLLDHIDDEGEAADTGKLFDQVDFVIKRFNLRDRLKIALLQTPDEVFISTFISIRHLYRYLSIFMFM